MRGGSNSSPRQGADEDALSARGVDSESTICWRVASTGAVVDPESEKADCCICWLLGMTADGGERKISVSCCCVFMESKPAGGVTETIPRELGSRSNVTMD